MLEGWLDFNAKVGSVKVEDTVGPHGIGSRNDRGDRLVEWCFEHDLAVMNTWFRHHKRLLWTWKSPGDSSRNQIDFIIINKRSRNSIRQAKTYPGADINSDRVPVIATVSLKLKKAFKAKSRGLYDTDLLGKNKTLTDQFNVEAQNTM